MKLVTVSQMQAIEKEAYASGLSYEQMMENAGQGLADVMYELFEDEEQMEIVGLVGPGNNGGDTLVALSELAAEGWMARPTWLDYTPLLSVPVVILAKDDQTPAEHIEEFESTFLGSRKDS